MPTTVPPRRMRRPMRPDRVVGALAAAALAVTVAPLPAAQASESSTASTTTKSDVTLVHANILSQLSVERFQADVRTVLGKKPDLITYNEVPLRQDSVIAPNGYDLQRSQGQPLHRRDGGCLAHRPLDRGRQRHVPDLQLPQGSRAAGTSGSGCGSPTG